MPRTIGHGFLRSSQAATKIVFLAFSLRPSRLRGEGAVPLTAKTRRAQRNPRRRILSGRRRIFGLAVRLRRVDTDSIYPCISAASVKNRVPYRVLLRAAASILALSCALSAPVFSGEARDVSKPRELVRFDEMPKPVQLPDGTLMAIFHPTNGGMKEVTARTSKDGGRNWSAQDALFKLPS